MIYFDHCFTNDPKHRFLKRLEKSGFILKPETVEHPGQAFCRFIMFGTGTGANKKFQYLEFVDQRGKKKQYNEGLLLGFSRGLEGFAKKLSRSVDVQVFHKNYAWKENSRDRLPGWNFVSFKNLAFRTLPTYFIEYEPSPTRKKRKAPNHPNGVHSIIAVELNVNAPGKSFFKKILDISSGDSRKHGSTRFNLISAPRNEIHRVILKCKNIDKFIRRCDIDEEIEWNGKRAALIRNPAGLWDIVVI